ncbi:hypothetical protein KEM60_03181 [Austwickia sp. TVS 96-490-7B]|uniref:NYN domain-containing protein n=1 Tax=Austwickia sp. TVS 96-490-7B TaxID=2830843 RepID=UPI001C59D6B4|nr:NYN domain-containing protein [Austwickia sp. TVS 96-490-7B]MBW3086952.1 hypothetical protein [Austwickia sp. TVS 96-490-7B]
MRSYCAVYVDAGYLYAATATRVTGTSLRTGVTIDHQGLIEGLINQAQTHSGLPLLRVNWYDCVSDPDGRLDATQRAIGQLPHVKLRLGRLSPSGEQKGVDLRLGLDLVSHARNRIVDTIYLICGDDDLTEAVEEAQSDGVQVVLLAVPNPDHTPHGVAANMVREADGMILIDADTIDQNVRQVTRLVPPGVVPCPPQSPPGGAAPKPGEQTSSDSSTVPSPATLAQRRATRPNGAPTPQPSHPGGTPAASGAPTPAVLATPPAAQVVFRSETGRPSHGRNGQEETRPAIDAAAIDGVCQRVLESWLASASDEERRQLFAGRPSIPSDIDRALLLDLSGKLGIYEIPEADRFALRARFWALIPTPAES